MKEKPFIYRDNQAIHDKIMRERVRLIITQRDIEFTLTHQHDTLEELSQYLRQCKKAETHPCANGSGWRRVCGASIRLVGKRPETERI